MAQFDTIIVGAGPYGLSLAAHLRARGASFAIVGAPMDAWRNHMPPGMLLRSEGFASSLSAPNNAFPLQEYCEQAKIKYEPIGWPVPLRDFVDYAQWFRENAVGPIVESRLVRLDRTPAGYGLLLENGEAMQARNVVLAVGLADFKRIPAVLAALPTSYFSHSYDISALERFRGMDVTVVGAGQSALGLAALLHEAGSKVRLVARARHLNWNTKPSVSRGMFSHLLQPENGLGPGWRGYLLQKAPGWFRWLPLPRRMRMVARSWGPSGAWWLQDRVEGKVDINLGQEITAVRLRGKGLALSVSSAGASREIYTDYLIAATGYAVDMRRLAFLSAEIQARLVLHAGAPQLSANFESSIKGLFVIGHASAQSFGPVMRFVCGAGYAAPRLARRLVRYAGKWQAGGLRNVSQRAVKLRELSPL